MPDEEVKTVIVTQPEDARFALDHAGGVAFYGDKEHDALQHEFAGQIVHRIAPNQPLVHVLGWSEENSVSMSVSGQLTLTGDADAPLQVHMLHEFANTHHQTHEVTLAPVDHSLKVKTSLAEPIHHALQLTTPLELRFCNAWLISSNYTVEVMMSGSPLLSINLTGATRVEPRPCADEVPCLPAERYIP